MLNTNNTPKPPRVGKNISLKKVAADFRTPQRFEPVITTEVEQLLVKVAACKEYTVESLVGLVSLFNQVQQCIDAGMIEKDVVTPPDFVDHQAFLHLQQLITKLDFKKVEPIAKLKTK